MSELIRRLNEKYMSSIEDAVGMNNDKRDVIFQLFTYDSAVTIQLKEIANRPSVKNDLELHISKKYNGYVIPQTVVNFCINMPNNKTILKNYINTILESEVDDVYDFAVKLLGRNIVI